jgi:hypothetical protein
MKAVAKRLLRLEAHFGSMVAAARTAGGLSGAEVIAQNLADLGIVREPNESLAEMSARAMGITIPELKCELRRLAGC